jgi:hypothetical protein
MAANSCPKTFAIHFLGLELELFHKSKEPLSTQEPQPGAHPKGLDGEWTENYFLLSSRSLPKHGSLRSASVFTALYR